MMASLCSWLRIVVENQYTISPNVDVDRRMDGG
jgi:hypothetical protein